MNNTDEKLCDNQFEQALIQAMSEPNDRFAACIRAAAEDLLTVQYNSGAVSEADYDCFLDNLMAAVSYLQDQYRRAGRDLNIPIDEALLDKMAARLLDENMQIIDKALRKVEQLSRFDYE